MVTQLKIDGMSCQNCVQHVREALAGVEGVEQVEVNLERGQASVVGRASVDSLIEAVREEGYHAQPL